MISIRTRENRVYIRSIRMHLYIYPITSSEVGISVERNQSLIQLRKKMQKKKTILEEVVQTVDHLDTEATRFDEKTKVVLQTN